MMAKRRGTTARNVRVILVPSDTMPTYDPSNPDPRLRELVRFLARQAARKFIEEERERTARKHIQK
jgi:hypothetical protein